MKQIEIARIKNMPSFYSSYTDSVKFFAGNDPFELVKNYSSPLYVYNENILRARCRELKNLCKLPSFVVSYSSKANANPALLKIVREEGLWADAMSPGELCATLAAGYEPDRISYICNNVSAEEMRLAIKYSRMVGLDSISQLERFGQICLAEHGGGRVMLRFNPGIGAGHHQKVVTAGKETKFGISLDDLPQVKKLLAQYKLTLVGINQHIGSLFMEATPYIQAAEWLLSITDELDLKALEVIDFGGGFGIPYHKHAGEERLNLNDLGSRLETLVSAFVSRTGYKGLFMIEPGRYIPAECGLVLGRVNAVKDNGPTRFAGTDVGFTVLARPMLYEAYHEMEAFREHCTESYTPDAAPISSDPQSGKAADLMPQTIVGNICESGDILAKDRSLPELREGDLLALLDAGAYGYAMSSNYNLRLRPAEVLITGNGEVKRIRGRQSLGDLLSPEDFHDFPSQFRELLSLSPC